MDPLTKGDTVCRSLACSFKNPTLYIDFHKQNNESPASPAHNVEKARSSCMQEHRSDEKFRHVHDTRTRKNADKKEKLEVAPEQGSVLWDHFRETKW